MADDELLSCSICARICKPDQDGQCVYCKNKQRLASKRHQPAYQPPDRIIKQPAETITLSSNASCVWVYWAGGAVGDELLWSVRLAQKHLADVSNFAVCGDVPKWFDGHGINSPKWTHSDHRKRFGNTKWTKWTDSIIKLQRIIDDPNITDDFLWMYDDTFIVKPTSIAELAVPRSLGYLNQRAVGNLWRQCRARTAGALMKEQLPINDYSTHLPMVYNKQKLQQTIDLFECHTRPRVIESLYGNHHLGKPERVGQFFHYRRRPAYNWQPPPAAVVVNVGQVNDLAIAALARLIGSRESQPLSSKSEAFV